MSKITFFTNFKTNLLNLVPLLNNVNQVTKFIRLDKPSISYKYNNGIISFFNKKPIKLEESLITNSNDDYYLIHIQRNLDNDTYLNTFLKGTDIINQITYTKFKIGLPTDETADIKIDYINRIDMIDALNINIKVSNIIN